MLLHLCFPLMLVFQFHKGTIRTQRCSVTLTTLAHFNSIKVQLEPALQTSSFTTLRNFNSIKVQLELLGELCMPSYREFQFHKGTIRTFSSYEHDFYT